MASLNAYMYNSAGWSIASLYVYVCQKKLYSHILIMIAYLIHRERVIIHRNILMNTPLSFTLSTLLSSLTLTFITFVLALVEADKYPHGVDFSFLPEYEPLMTGWNEAVYFEKKDMNEIVRQRRLEKLRS